MSIYTLHIKANSIVYKLVYKTSKSQIFMMRKICARRIQRWPVIITIKGQMEVKVMWHVWAQPVVILTKISYDRSMYEAAVANLLRVNNVNTSTHPFPTHPHIQSPFQSPLSNFVWQVQWGVMVMCPQDCNIFLLKDIFTNLKASRIHIELNVYYNVIVQCIKYSWDGKWQAFPKW